MTDATARPHYAGATTASERSLQMWMPRILSAETEYGPQRDIATGRARDLAINSAYGANGLRIHRDNVIGPSFSLALRPNADALGITREKATEWARFVQREFHDYANSVTFDCDAQRVQTFPWLLHTAYATFLMSGEALGILKWKESHSGYRTCLLLVEPERLSMPLGMPENKLFRRGIETDEDGAPLAYHVRTIHPTDPISFFNVFDPLKWERIPRATAWGRPMVLHMIDRHRPDMRRGLSQFAAAIKHMKLTDTYDQAEVESAILQAMFAAVIKTDLTREEALGVLGAQGVLEKTARNPADSSLAYMGGISSYHKEMGLEVNGARVTHLLPGESLELVKPESPGLSYEAFQTAVVRKLAAALGTSAESLSRDFSSMSFASAKMSLGDSWRYFLRNRELVTRQLGLPFVAAWMEEAIDEKRIPLPSGKMGSIEEFWTIRGAIFSRSTFMSWGPPQVDPVKEREAQKLGMENNLTTLEAEAFEQGQDWEDILEQRSREREHMTRLGIPLPETLTPSGAKKPDDPAEEAPPPKRKKA